MVKVVKLGDQVGREVKVVKWVKWVRLGYIGESREVGEHACLFQPW